MARRLLRKIDPSLDLTGRYFEAGEVGDHFDGEVLFRRQAPLEVEVGSGKGLFLLRASEARPERDFLGVEIARKYARFAAARLAKEGRSNAVVLQDDARRIFREWLPDACAAAVHIYFPDPWWKKRHHKRRIMTGDFLQHVERVLAPGGRLHFWTDVATYFHSSLELIRQTTQLRPLEAPGETAAAHDLDYRTHFERRMRLHGQRVYRAILGSPAEQGS